MEGALLAKNQQARTWKKKNYKKNLSGSSESRANNYNKGKGEKKSYPHCRRHKAIIYRNNDKPHVEGSKVANNKQPYVKRLRLLIKRRRIICFLPHGSPRWIMS